MRWLAVLVGALALVAAGCGGGGNSSTTAAETTTTETTTAEDTTSGDTTDTTDLSAVLGDKDCLALASVGATIAQAVASASGPSEDQQLEELASKAPDEIKPDVETLAQAFSTYASKIKDLGLKVGSTPTADQVQQLQAAAASLNDPKVTAASKNLEAWAKSHCTG